MEKIFFNQEELVKMTGMSKWQLLQYRNKGYLRHIPEKRPLIFPKSEVDKFIQKIEDDIEKSEQGNI